MPRGCAAWKRAADLALARYEVWMRFVKNCQEGKLKRRDVVGTPSHGICAIFKFKLDSALWYL
jgi:hypothetical protein